MKEKIKKLRSMTHCPRSEWTVKGLGTSEVTRDLGKGGLTQGSSQRTKRKEKVENKN